MLDELNNALNIYNQKWHSLVENRKDRAFFEECKPTAVGWKTNDLVEFNERAAELQGLSDQVHFGWVNERWLGTFHLKGEPLVGGISIVKLMQCRPGSQDAVGLDHLDYFIPTAEDIKPLLAAEPNLRWTEETNGDHCKWVSLWFEETEAKLRRDTVLQVCADEMLEYQERLLQ